LEIGLYYNEYVYNSYGSQDQTGNYQHPLVEHTHLQVIEGSIVDVGANYQQATDVERHIMFGIYSTLGEWFDTDNIKNVF